MNWSLSSRWTVFPRPHLAAGMAVVAAVVICLLAAGADAAARSRGGSSGGITIDPVPRFDDSEVRALIEKPSIIDFSVDNPRIASGGSAKLTWRVENADSVSISSIGSVGLSGTRSVSPSAKTTYTLSARNQNGTVTRAVTVDITNLAAVVTKMETVKIVTPVIMLGGVHFDFVDKAGSATWGSSKPLSFGGSGGTSGWARVINSVRAEDNKDYAKVLQTTPEVKADGFIFGEYSVAIPPNAKLLATVGFTRGHGSADGATVSVQVRQPPVHGRRMPWQQILTKTITADGKLDPIEVDLKAYANKTVSIRLVVNARSKADDDIVLWIAPRIVK
jgi:hypothetical protein